MLDVIQNALNLQAQQPSAVQQTATGPNAWQILGVLGLGGICTELLRVVIAFFKSRSDLQRTASKIVDARLDAILKSAEELVSRINSLANTDFVEIRSPLVPETAKADEVVDPLSYYYLLLHFWASLELLRRETVSIDLSKDPRGERILAFARALESKAVRIVHRHQQRALAEIVMADGKTGGPSIVHFGEFIRRWKVDVPSRELLQLLMPPSTNSSWRRWRQSVLMYGVVMIAFINELDPGKHATRPHKVHLNKLTLKTKRSLRYAVFQRTLTFVREAKNYHGLR